VFVFQIYAQSVYKYNFQPQKTQITLCQLPSFIVLQVTLLSELPFHIVKAMFQFSIEKYRLALLLGELSHQKIFQVQVTVDLTHIEVVKLDGVQYQGKDIFQLLVQLKLAYFKVHIFVKDTQLQAVPLYQFPL